jgi:lipopolysaccharide export LptBFGC system permease protein LptF
MNPDPETRKLRDQASLGRLRLGVEPLAVQVERYRRVTWVLTAIPLALAAFILSLFTVFGRPGIGLIVVLVLFAPVVTIAWIDFLLLKRRAERYERAAAEATHSPEVRS